MVAKNITDKAMLVRVSITAWSGRKYDPLISAKVARDHGAKGDVGNFNKALLSKHALKKIENTYNAARQFHYANSLPWQDDGYRILPSANYLTYTKGMSDWRNVYESAVRDFLETYEDEVVEARTRLNGAFNERDYPAKAIVARKFSFDFCAMPLPDQGDFRVDMSTEESDRIRADIETRVNNAIAGAMTDLWQRIHNVVSHLSERLKAYSVDAATGKVSAPFRDSLVNNIRELVDILPRLNVTGDAKLTALTAELDSLFCQYDPDTLRNSETLRESVISDADRILADMAGYVS